MGPQRSHGGTLCGSVGAVHQPDSLIEQVANGMPSSQGRRLAGSSLPYRFGRHPPSTTGGDHFPTARAVGV